MGVARSHPVVHDDALVVGVALVVLLVPLGTDFVQVLLLIREHHLVHSLKTEKQKKQGWRMEVKDACISICDNGCQV